MSYVPERLRCPICPRYRDIAEEGEDDISIEYIYYISNINPDIWADEGTADPAYYADYLEICSSFFVNNECSIQEGLEYAKRYLDEHNLYEHKQFNSNIDEVVAVFNKCTLSDWKKIYEWIRTQRCPQKRMQI